MCRGVSISRFHLPFSSLFPEYADVNLLGRVYGLSQEPRELAIYLITILPFLLMATIERKYLLPPLLQSLMGYPVIYTGIVMAPRRKSA